jgi:hypothetical protein
MYNEKTCYCDKAAWFITGITENGIVCAIFECHATDDQDSPNGVGWYFAAHMKGKDGHWDEHGGGMYWDYENATDPEHIIAEAVPFKEFITRQIPYKDFEDICFGEDKDKETAWFIEAGVVGPEKPTNEKSYNVRITETLERTITVKANNRDEALDKVKSDYKHETHVLDADDFKCVNFTVGKCLLDKELAR